MNINVLISFNWNTLLSILLFLIALGVLITIHEFGHFIAAKSFKVYCTDFSIGFGPKILKIKRKKGETTFSLGILPFGGYVSMLGEDDEESVPEGINVSRERTLIGISRWKRVVIMSAGIIMNFVLAYLIFFISASCFPQVIANSWYEVGENSGIVSLNESASFSNNDQLVPATFYYRNGEFYLESDIDNPLQTEAINILNEGAITLKNGTEEKKYIATLSYSLAGGVNDTDISKNIFLYETNSEPIEANPKYFKPAFDDNGSPIRYEFKAGDEFVIQAKFINAKDSSIAITNPNDSFSYRDYDYEEITDEKGETLYQLKTFDCEISLKSNETAFDPLNVSFYKYDYWYGWDSFRVAGDDWLQSTTLISQALGNLFIGQGWDQLGGPLAIFTQTTQILESNPFYAYLNTWGTISVNLALFNLLPFPGLDGWQILVEIVEGSVNGIRKLIYKSKKKKKDEEEVKDKPIEITNNNVIIDQETVTANKNVSLTIGKDGNAETEYKDWEIPTKVKTIMSYIGLGLLLLLMVFVLIKDIIMVF